MMEWEVLKLKKGQYLAEVTVQQSASLTDYVNEAVAMCKEENNPENLEVHQIVCVRPNEFLILINYYK